MRRLTLSAVVLALIGSNASAATVERKIGYEIGGKAFEGVLIYDDGVTAKRPASQTYSVLATHPRTPRQSLAPVRWNVD